VNFSKRIKLLSEEQIELSVASPFLSVQKRVVLQVSTTDKIILSHYNSMITFDIESKTAVLGDAGIFFRAVLRQLTLLTDSCGLDFVDQLPHRELENILRDVNSVPAYPADFLPKAENIVETCKRLIVTVKRFDHQFSEGKDLTHAFNNSNFFEQVKILQKLQHSLGELLQFETSCLPRLNLWIPNKGELSFIVTSVTKLDLLEMELYKLFWLELGPIRSIKMLAK